MAIKDLFIRLGLKGSKKTEKGLKGVDGSLKSLGKSALKIGAYFYAAKGVITGLQKVVAISSELQGVQSGFENLTSKVGMSSETLSKLTQATDGTVSSLELMKQANNAMLLDITDSEDKMAEMFDTAQRLASALGEDATFGIESLVTGMGRQSKLMLDNLGIIVDTNKAYEKHAEKLGITTSELTDQQKKQAFNNETMLKAKELVESLGEEQTTTADRINQLKSSATNMAGVLGQALTPAFNASLDLLTSFSGIVTNAVNSLAKIDLGKTGKNIIQNTEAIMTALKDTFKVVVDFFPDIFKKAMGKLSPILEKIFGKIIDGIKTVASIIWEPISISFSHLGSMIKSGWVTIMNGLISGINKVIETMNKIPSPFDDIPTIDLMDKVEIEPLMDKLKETKIAEALFGGPDDIQTTQEFADATAEIWANYFEKVKVLREEEVIDVQEKEQEKVEIAEQTTQNLGQFISTNQENIQKFTDAGMGLANKLFQHETTLINNKMNAELKSKQKTFESSKQFIIDQNTVNGQLTAKGQEELAKLEDNHGNNINNIKEKYRQQNIDAQKKLKPMKIAQAISNTALAVTGALGAPPFLPTNLALAALVGAAGAVEVATIQAQVFAKGGIVQGVGNRDTVPAMLTPGEIVLNQAQQQNLAGGMGGITLNISAPLVDETIVDTIIPAIEKAQKMNLA